MKVKHNKKRNVGVLFAQLSEYISSALVEGREQDSHVALSILKNHFVKGTELHKEFRLFRRRSKFVAASVFWGGTPRNFWSKTGSKVFVTILLNQKSVYFLGVIKKKRKTWYFLG